MAPAQVYTTPVGKGALQDKLPPAVSFFVNQTGQAPGGPIKIGPGSATAQHQIKPPAAACNGAQAAVLTAVPVIGRDADGEIRKMEITAVQILFIRDGIAPLFHSRHGLGLHQAAQHGHHAGDGRFVHGTLILGKSHSSQNTND